MITQTWHMIRSQELVLLHYSQIHLSPRTAAALLNEDEWRQSRWIHPYELSDTNKVLIVDAKWSDGYSGLDMEDIGHQASRGFSSEQQAEVHSRKGKHRWSELAPWDSHQHGQHLFSFLFKEHQEPAQVQQLLFYTSLYALKYLTVSLSNNKQQQSPFILMYLQTFDS